jgi:hypothetical protein
MSQLLNRRSIVKLAGILPVAAGAAKAGDSRSRQFKVELFAEGVIPVLGWPFIAPPPPLPPEILEEIVAGRLEGRLRATLSSKNRNRKILVAQVYLAPPSSPLGAAQDPPYTTPPTTALFEMDAQEVIVTGWPKTLVVAGVVIADRVISPYGPFQGRSAAVTFGFAGEGRTEFTMFGVTVAGNHVAYCPAAIGSLHVRRDD